MQKMLFVGFLLLILVLLPVSAQNEDDHLVHPTTSEYLQEIGTYLEANPETIADNTTRDVIVSTLSISILNQSQSDDTAKFTDLFETYQRLNIGYLDGAYRGDWNVLLVQRWLDENQPDLSNLQELDLAPEFLISITPRDFNVDGQDEYVLEVWNADTIHMYLVAVAESNGYRIIDPGLPWSGYTASGKYSEGDGYVEEYYFIDLNDDNLPEWLVLFYGDRTGNSGVGFFALGALFVVGWREDDLQLLSPSWLNRELDLGQELTFLEVDRRELLKTISWEFINLDSDSELEIAQAQSYTNNWGCRRVETMQFDWNADTDMYLYQDTEIVYDESQNCIQQEAEEAMWEHDYQTAIDLFEQALTRSAKEAETDYGHKLAQARNQYLRARLAMAYLLTHQLEFAEPLLDTLNNEVITDDAITAYVTVLNNQQGANLVTMCIDAFNVFADNFPDIVIGGTSDNQYYDGPAYHPAKVGCDAPTMIHEQLQSVSIPVNDSPEDWLENNGIGIDKSLVADFNLDGADEILVWTTVPGVQILFIPQGDYYTVSFPTIDPYQYEDELETWLLPDEAGVAIVTFDDDLYEQSAWPTFYSVIDGMGGGPGPECIADEGIKYVNTVRLWRLNGSEFEKILGMYTCANSISAALGDGGQSTITTHYQDLRYIDGGGDVLEPVSYTYIWDKEENQYLRIPTVTPTPVITPIPTSTPEPEPARKYYSVIHAFSENDDQAVIDMTPDTLDLSETAYPDNLLTEMYLRAISLVKLDQYEAGLKLFISLQSTTPEHIIGQLSALHIE